MKGICRRGFFVLLMAGACVLRLDAGEPVSLVVPETRYGQHILPDEKPLKNWKVYSTPIVLDRDTLVKAAYRNDTPEAVAVSFFASIAKGNREYLSLLSPRVRPEIKKSIAVHSKKEGAIFQKLQIFAKLETDIALTIKKTEGSFLANKEDMGKVVKHFGPFNVVIFFETPPCVEDGFILLAKENTSWKVLAVTGWLYRPGGQE